ncbi:hypothetical protein CHS0354_038150, partial [Potamilus streckersoni]
DFPQVVAKIRWKDTREKNKKKNVLKKDVVLVEKKNVGERLEALGVRVRIPCELLSSPLPISNAYVYDK